MTLWTPSQITTALWLDAADASTLYDATSGGSLVAADGTVARWEDKSGNARHVTQATSINRPLRKTSYEGGRDSILFDGSNDAIALAADLSISTHTVFVVARNTATITSATAFQSLLSGGSYTFPSTTTSEWFFGAGSVTGNLTNERLTNIAIAHWTTAADVWGYGKTDADVSTAIIAALSYSPGGTFVGKMNGSTDYASVSSRGAFSGTNTRYPTLLRSIGNRFSNTTVHWSGTISEVVVVTSILSSGDIEKVEGYLAHKWGMTANLPGGHPYKSVAPRAYKYPSLRTTLPVAGYYARLDAGSVASDQFTADGAQDGTLTNGATRADDSGLAYSFDPSNDYITIASQLIPTGATARTVAFWFKCTGTISTRQWLVYGGTESAYQRFGIEIESSKLTFNYFIAAQQFTTTLTANTWYHAAVVYNGGTGVSVFLNGTKQTFTMVSALNTGPAANTRIGIFNNLSSFPFNGLIDDLVFYNNLAASDADVGYLASQRGAIYALIAAGGSPINGQSLIRPADSKPYQQLIGV